MRVAIDTRALRPPLAGIGHFTYRLTEAMLPLLSSDETLLAFNGWALELLDRRFLDRIAAANSGTGSLGSQRATGRAGRKLYNALRPVAAVRKGVRAVQAHRFRRNERRFDVFHAMNYVPAGATSRPVLPFIHDLSHIRHPNLHPRDRVEWLQDQLALVAEAPLVQTNSQFSKGEITALLGIPARADPRHLRSAGCRLPARARMVTTHGSQKTGLRRAALFSLSARASRARTSRRSPRLMLACRRICGRGFRSYGAGRPDGATFRCRLPRQGPRTPDKYESLATFPIVNWRRSIVTARYLSWRRFTKASVCRWSRRWPAVRASR